jgi:DNA repair photolyase
MGIATPEDFHTLVYVKVGAEEETARRLAAVVRKGERIALGSATDPYQPGEAESRVTRRFLEMVARHRGVRLGITTKGALVLRDLDLLQRISARSEVSVHVSLNSPRADLLRRIEPLAPPPDVRIEMMRRLTEAGVETWLGLAPILPGLTDAEPDLDLLLGRVREAGVRHLFTNMLFLRSPTREKYLRWLEAEFPRYLEAYRKAYEGRVYLEGAYRERIKDIVERLKRKHGFATRDEDDEGSGPPRQLLLFE